MTTPDRPPQSLRRRSPAPPTGGTRQAPFPKRPHEGAGAGPQQPSPESLALAAHELRNHLTPLILQADLLHSGRLGTLSIPQAQAVDQIMRSIDRTLLLLHDVMDASRIQAGRFEIHPSRINLDQLVLETVTRYRDQARQVDIELIHVADREASLEADPHRLMQVVTNLVTNAIKFTPAGGTVTTRVTVEPDHLVLAVEDTGRGLAPGEAEVVFRPFRQCGTPASSRNGSGLGLYIAKEIVAGHGGTIEAASAGIGQGSRFVVRLPRRLASA